MRHNNGYKSVKKAFLLAFLAVSLFSLSACSFTEPDDKYIATIGAYSMQIMHQIGRNMELELNRMEAISIEITFSDQVQAGLRKLPEVSGMENLSIHHDLTKILLAKFSLNPSVVSARILSNKGETIESYGASSIKKEVESKLCKEASEGKGKAIWRLADKESSKNIVLIRSMIDVESKGILGFIVVELDSRFLTNSYRDVSLGADGEIFVLDSQGIVISSSDPAIEIGKPYKNVTLSSQMLNSLMSEERELILSEGGKKFLVTYAQLERFGWYIVSKVPVESLK